MMSWLVGEVGLFIPHQGSNPPIVAGLIHVSGSSHTIKAQVQSWANLAE